MTSSPDYVRRMIELFAHKNFWAPKEIAGELGFADARPINDAINDGSLRALEPTKGHRRVPLPWLIEWLSECEIQPSCAPSQVSANNNTTIGVERPRQRRRATSRPTPRRRGVVGLQHLAEQR